jgi:hypothetical protein
VRSLDAATRRELSKKVDQYKKSLASLSSDHKKIREKEEREGLFGDRDGNAVRHKAAGVNEFVVSLTVSFYFHAADDRRRRSTAVAWPPRQTSTRIAKVLCANGWEDLQCCLPVTAVQDERNDGQVGCCAKRNCRHGGSWYASTERPMVFLVMAANVLSERQLSLSARSSAATARRSKPRIQR